MPLNRTYTYIGNPNSLFSNHPRVHPPESCDSGFFVLAGLISLLRKEAISHFNI